MFVRINDLEFVRNPYVIFALYRN